jgi:hypothetical protein
MMDESNKELSSTLYKQQKLTAAYEALKKSGFNFTSYEERWLGEYCESLSHIKRRYSPSRPVYGWVRYKEAAGDSTDEGRCTGIDEAAESRPICSWMVEVMSLGPDSTCEISYLAILPIL